VDGTRTTTHSHRDHNNEQDDRQVKPSHHRHRSYQKNTRNMLGIASCIHFRSREQSILSLNNSASSSFSDISQLFSLQNMFTDTNLIHKTLQELKIGKRIKCLRLGPVEIATGSGHLTLSAGNDKPLFKKKVKPKEYYWILNDDETFIEIKDSKKRKVKALGTYH